MNAVATWWDGVELWIAGLPFVPQVAVVLLVVVPAAALTAYVVDIVLSALFDARRRYFRRTPADRDPAAVTTGNSDPREK
ncbi:MULTISPECIES: hypothetical protein [Nocardiaceae]|uniref:Uncharacterized protein n=1 Tax=Rhodococcoides corynebacterioides TaxID=53972 RepID=A0ABS2KUK9_9NOCA|nr:MULTISPECIES: hypothetical protein [Rhodococcus]MBM7415295.1 hypothetical protein [Rhodococcus corynebacterioides]MBP1117757.1 hypothetical protein [Rhodococcus sp. PvP016]MBY6681258.1 hypothetical protein [Rhodococcus sp. BP-316]MBY6686383.1 hypothetical protein [Rhodococcus sp. BP-288]MBY6693528.1 hypothetical protein [Rhodococcus sp. BP-188]